MSDDYPAGGVPFAEQVRISASYVPQTDNELERTTRGYVGHFVELVMGIVRGPRFQAELDDRMKQIAQETPREVIHKVGLDGYRMVNRYGSVPGVILNKLAMLICTVLGLIGGVITAILWHSSTVTVPAAGGFQEYAMQSVIDDWWFKVVIVLVAIVVGRLAGSTFMKEVRHQYVAGSDLEVDPSRSDKPIWPPQSPIAPSTKTN
jgi:hypothetical protein